jgi:hypothetical protein
MDIINKATELQSKGQPAAEEASQANKQVTHVGPTPRPIPDSEQISAVISIPTVETKSTPKRLVEGPTFVTTRETVSSSRLNRSLVQYIQSRGESCMLTTSSSF